MSPRGVWCQGIVKATIGWTLDTVHNSRRPLDRLQYMFALCDIDLWPLTFWPNINWWARYHDVLKLCNFSFSRFGFIARRDRQTESHDRYTYATVGMSTVGLIKWSADVSRKKKCRGGLSGEMSPCSVFSFLRKFVICRSRHHSDYKPINLRCVVC